MPLPNKIAFLDIETTGGSLRQDRIIEIGVLRVEDNKLTSTFQTLINPEKHLPPEIQLLTGITPSEVETAPTFYQIKDQLLEILKDCVIAAHNVRFDYSFIKQEFRRLEMEFSSKQFCTVKLSRSLFPQYPHHNLDSVIERLNLQCKNRHRAFDDAKILWDFYQHVLNSFSLTTIEGAFKRITKRVTLPIKLSQEELDNLPESPGVYIFYGENDLPLYIGKSINIRDRVLSHFSADHLSSTELKISQQIQRMEFIETAGELGALLKESDLIKKMQPLYNRKLRSKKNIVLLKLNKTKKYFSIEIDTSGEITIDNLEDVVGVHKSVRQTKQALVAIAKEYQLCEKQLGLEKTSSSCFSYRLGKCKGACVEKEIPAFHNVRIIEAFSKNRLKQWPFNGPIIVKEENLYSEIGQAYLIDKWCCIGTIDAPKLEQYITNNFDYSFDLDSYKIISAYIKSPKNQKNIRVISTGTFTKDLDSLGIQEGSLI